MKDINLHLRYYQKKLNDTQIIEKLVQTHKLKEISLQNIYPTKDTTQIHYNFIKILVAFFRNVCEYIISPPY